MDLRRSGPLAALVVLFALAFAGTAYASDLGDTIHQWLPDSDGATWTYVWSDSSYAPQPTRERYTLAGRSGNAFRLAWTTSDLGNGDGTVSSDGTIDYTRTDAGLVNTNWATTPPPSQFPILCANPSQCGNSLASTHFMVIWGTRSPVLAEPLLRDTRWNSLGGANNDVSSSNTFEGLDRIVVQAFPKGVTAAKVVSQITQAGAVGDPYGSGVRTVWWVYGVGPVKVEFRHTGGEVSQAELVSSNLTPINPPSDENYFPLNNGDTMTYRWWNSKHMRKPSTQRFTVSQVVNGTARVDVKNVSGPIAVAGSYVFSTRLSGVTNLSTFTKAASRAKFPPLGPRSLPSKQRRRLFTPFDLMVFGYNPVLPAYPAKGQSWTVSRGSRDFSVFRVTGKSKVLGFHSVRTPAGRFRALVVQADLKQKGFPYGSGRRTEWFAHDEGLVKLVFRHRDGSVSTVERVH